MPITKCLNCGNKYQWNWEEAFDKFGFGDGDGQIETYRVQEVLQSAGYEVESDQWGLHNIVIDSIKKDGLELMPDEDTGFAIGYDCPRKYLPKEIINLLDEELQ